MSSYVWNAIGPVTLTEYFYKIAKYLENEGFKILVGFNLSQRPKI